MLEAVSESGDGSAPLVAEPDAEADPEPTQAFNPVKFQVFLGACAEHSYSCNQLPTMSLQSRPRRYMK